MPPRKLYFENVRLGDELPAMARAPIERVQLARYAGATGDFNSLHVDEVAAKAQGMPSVLVPNTLGMGFLAQLVGDWARGAQVKRLGCRFSRTLWPGDTLVCKGRVADRWGAEGKYFIEVEVWAENQKGELVLRGSVTLQIFYSVEDENRFRMGQPPLIVSVPRQSIRPAVTPAPAAAPAKAATPAKKPAPAGKPAKAAAPAKRPAPAKKPAAKAKKPAPKKPAKAAKAQKKKK
jgi:acyl dehydratase